MFDKRKAMVFTCGIPTIVGRKFDSLEYLCDGRSIAYAIGLFLCSTSSYHPRVSQLVGRVLGDLRSAGFSIGIQSVNLSLGLPFSFDRENGGNFNLLEAQS